LCEQDGQEQDHRKRTAHGFLPYDQASLLPGGFTRKPAVPSLLGRRCGYSGNNALPNILVTMPASILFRDSDIDNMTGYIT